MQAENDDDLDGGQRSTVFGQKKPWCKVRMMMTLMEVKGHQKVKWGKLSAMATIFGQKKRWCKLQMMMTLMEVKGNQRSNFSDWAPNYVIYPENREIFEK